MKRTHSFFLFCLLLPLTLIGQVLVPKSPLALNFDYSRFRYSDTEGYVEVLYAMYPSLVTLSVGDQQYRGSVEVTTRIRRKTDDSVVAAQKFLWPVTVQDTTEAMLRRAQVFKLVFAVPFGAYSLEVFAKDAASPSRMDSGRVTLLVDRPTTTTSVSDVDLCSSIEPSTDKNDPFYKNSYSVIPNPSLFFGATGIPVVFTYAELYDLVPGMSYSLALEVLDGKNQVLKSRVRSRQFSIRNAVDVSTLNVAGIQSGKFRFVLRISDSAGKEIARTEKPIFVFNPSLPQVSASPTSARAAELAGMTDDELAEEFREAQYLAVDKDIKLFKNITSADGRREYLATFWGEIESGQRGVRDMTRALYLSRIKTANERFRAMGKLGWRSDRGRVLILFGEPDEIQRFPSSEGNKPYEIWNYYQLENGVIFAFIDRTGFGDYVLVHSTKRGELQDEGWERYLH